MVFGYLPFAHGLRNRLFLVLFLILVCSVFLRTASLQLHGLFSYVVPIVSMDVWMDFPGRWMACLACGSWMDPTFQQKKQSVERWLSYVFDLCSPFFRPLLICGWSTAWFRSVLLLHVDQERTLIVKKERGLALLFGRFAWSIIV